MWLRMRNVNRVRARGRLYYYHRPTRTRLPDDPHSTEFVRRLAELNEQMEHPDATVTQGTLADLIAAYRAAPDFKQLAPKTKKDYQRYLDTLGKSFGDIEVEALDGEFILELRDALSEKPRTADYTLQILSRLLTFAVERPSRFGVKSKPPFPKRMSHPTGYEPWPDSLIEAARAKAYPELRWVIEGGLYTAQRGQDVIAMTWPHYDGAKIDVAVEKTRTRLSVPVHPDLKSLLDNDIPKRAAVIFTTQTGRPWKLDHLRHEIRKLVENCGFANYSFHGLRKTAAVNLAEAGATLGQIMAVTGHKTAAMVLHYTRGADQMRLASAAIAKLPRKRK